MCLRITAGPLTAEEDIIVYKHIIARKRRSGTVFFSSYRRTPIEFNVLMRSAIEIWYGEVQMAFHSYATKDVARRQAKCYDERLVQCVIPKGSTYFTGFFMSDPAIASDHIIYKELLRK